MERQRLCKPPREEKEEILRQKAYSWCRQYLGGTWSRISQDEFSIEVLRGGLSNELFVCSLPENYPLLKEEPRKVLLRIYGRLYSELLSDIHAMVSEVVIFALLSERGVAPKLYAVFPEGRLEELLPARALVTEELRNPQISVMIAENLKKFHQLKLPLCKEPNLLWDTMNRFLEDIDSVITFDDPEKSKKLQIIRNMDLHREYEFLRHYLEATNSAVVFCHNDLQEGNILKMENKEGEREGDNFLRFIDFEFGGYNYSAFDIANHFCEWTMDYTVPEPPYFSLHPERYPTAEQQHTSQVTRIFYLNALAEFRRFMTQLLMFIRTYLGRNNLNEVCNKVTHEEEELMKTIDKFVLASHFLWGLWAVCQAKFSSIQFNYMEYALARLQAYQQQKCALGLR